MEAYKGNCHCGAFKFTVKLPSPGLKEVKMKSCDCSICSRSATLWIFPLPEKGLEIHSGEDSLQKYTFGSGKAEYYFCPKCGSNAMLRWGEGSGINARLLQEIEISELEITKMPGSAYGTPYEPPSFPPISEVEKVLKVEEGMKIYQGNCHCKTVSYSVVTKPILEQEVLSCNCSLCSRNGELYIYPSRPQVTIHTGSENLTPYAFLSEDSLHSFCRTCGISVLVKVLGEGKDKDVCPLNIRNFVEFGGLEKEGLRIKRYDGRKNDPQYVV